MTLNINAVLKEKRPSAEKFFGVLYFGERHDFEAD
jgi:hypothetical protein